MSRIRTIKPEMAKHELLFEIEQDLGCAVRFAWAQLPCQCDREGRFKWRPRPLKCSILPYDNCDFARVLDAWLMHGLVVKYRLGRDWYGWVPTFLKHQTINARESASSLPSIDDADEVIDHRFDPNQEVEDASLTCDAPVPHASVTRGSPVADASCDAPRDAGCDAACGEGKGREGKGKEGNVRSVRAREGLNGHTVPSSIATNGAIDDRLESFAGWQRFKSIYPRGIYAESDFALAEKFGEQRIAEGDATLADFIAGAERFRAQQDALGNIGTRWVQSPKSFFDRITQRWKDPFPLPAPDAKHNSMDTGSGWTPPLDDPKYNPDLAAKIRTEASKTLSRDELIAKLTINAGNSGRGAAK